MSNKKDRMTFQETMGLQMVKDRVGTATNDFLKKVYVIVKRELQSRGVVKKKTTENIAVEEDKEGQENADNGHNPTDD